MKCFWKDVNYEIYVIISCVVFFLFFRVLLFVSILWFIMLFDLYDPLLGSKYSL